VATPMVDSATRPTTISAMPPSGHALSLPVREMIWPETSDMIIMPPTSGIVSSPA